MVLFMNLPGKGFSQELINGDGGFIWWAPVRDSSVELIDVSGQTDIAQEVHKQLYQFGRTDTYRPIGRFWEMVIAQGLK